MRYVLVLALGLVAGWFGHALLMKPQQPQRAETTRKTVEEPPPVETPKPDPLPHAPTLPAPAEKTPTDETVVAPVAADPDMDRMREMVHSQSKMWRGFAGMQAKARAEALLVGLPFDAEREKKIQDLLQKEAELQAERAAAMMLGDEEWDPNAFQWFMGMPEELSPHLEQELATFLNDGELQVVRAEVKKAYAKQMTDMADMQIGMMQISDLSDDQKTRMRDVFAGKDMVSERFQQFGQVVRDREKFRRLLRGEGLKEEMEKQFVGTRQRVRDILTHEQFAKYEAYEKQMIAQAEMGLKMMSALLDKPREETRKPDGQ